MYAHDMFYFIPHEEMRVIVSDSVVYLNSNLYYIIYIYQYNIYSYIHVLYIIYNIHVGEKKEVI